MSTPQVESQLLVATFDLAITQSVLNAINNADRNSAAEEAGSASFSTEFNNRRHIHPRDFYEPRTHIHPTPVYEPRPVIHQHPRIALDQVNCPDRTPELPPMKLDNPIQPPWKILPWENQAQTRQTVKIHLIRTDVVHKGVLLDLFV